jgi:hypothetical protein
MLFRADDTGVYHPLRVSLSRQKFGAFGFGPRCSPAFLSDTRE